MQVKTAHTTLPISPSAAFAFLSDLSNVPKWAVEFVAGAFEVEGDRARVETAQGVITMGFRTHAPSGVIDIVVAPAPGVEVVLPTRVVPQPNGTSLYLFTLLQEPGQPDESFEEGFASLQRELDGLAGVLNGAAV